MVGLGAVVVRGGCIVQEFFSLPFSIVLCIYFGSTCVLCTWDFLSNHSGQLGMARLWSMSLLSRTFACHFRKALGLCFGGSRTILQKSV